MSTKESVHETWRQSVVFALRKLDGEAHLSDLNPVVQARREEIGIPLSQTWKATVRRVLQQAPETEQLNPGSGGWRLKQ